MINNSDPILIVPNSAVAVTEELPIVYLNINSYNQQKRQDLQLSIDSDMKNYDKIPHVICLLECKLKYDDEQKLDKFLAMDTYNHHYFPSRNPNTGGILFYVSQKLQFSVDVNNTYNI